MEHGTKQCTKKSLFIIKSDRFCTSRRRVLLEFKGRQHRLSARQSGTIQRRNQRIQRDMAQQPVQMNVGLGGPAWANPTGAPLQQQQQTMPTNVSSTIGGSIANHHEDEFFAPVSTLDEPIRETIMRDVRSVASKLKVVLLPMERSVCSFRSFTPT